RTLRADAAEAQAPLTAMMGLRHIGMGPQLNTAKEFFMQRSLTRMTTAIKQSRARRSPTVRPRYSPLHLEPLEQRIALSPCNDACILETHYNNLPYDTSYPEWASNVVNGRTFDSLDAITRGFPKYEWTPIYHPNNEYETNDLVGVSGSVHDVETLAPFDF